MTKNPISLTSQLTNPTTQFNSTPRLKYAIPKRLNQSKLSSTDLSICQIRFTRALPPSNDLIWGGANERDMADKTASTQPSTSFYDAALPVTHTQAEPSTPTNLYKTSSIHTILSKVNRSDNREKMNQFNNHASLMSPPEPTPHESFARSSVSDSIDSKMKSLYTMPGGRLPMSPPVSPATKNISTDEPSQHTVRDPILYPNTEQQGSPTSQAPLFTEEEALAAQQVVNGHLAARELSLFREASPPRQSEYELALEFKAEVAKAFNSNRSKWLNRERLYLLEDRALNSGSRRYLNIAPASGGRSRQAGIVKATQPKPHKRAPAQSQSTHIRSTPDRTTGPKVAREDKDFSALVDYCPPIDSLPTKYNSLKVDWKGAPIDLINDPHHDLLHPDELLLAANLRLDCATYLTSKRRIFIKRLEALRINKEFRKTDAQQACKIDVNKASKLWQAFDKVGWLDPKWVRKYT